MKKVLLVLLIVILLAGCGLGGWYFLTTNGKDNPMVGLKLELTNTAKIVWNEDYDNAYKTKVLGGQTEEAYINKYKDEPYEAIPFKRLSFFNGGVVECLNKDQVSAVNRYFITSPNGDIIKIYEDENCNKEYRFDYIEVHISKDDEGYWLLAKGIHYGLEYKGRLVFKLNEI